MATFFLKLLNMSISAGWMVLAVLVVRIFLRKAPRSLSVVLWALVGIRLLLPFSIESAVSLIPSAQTVPPEILYTQTPIIHSGFPAVNTVINPVLSETMAPISSDKINPMQVLTTVTAIVWLVGCIGVLLYGVISYGRIYRRVQNATHLFGNVYRAASIDTPFILGILFPKIYLPFEMNGDDVPYVLDHEQAHLKRWDHLWKPLGFFLLAIHWYNPLLWLAYVLLCRDIESACDERVAKTMNTEEKKAYSSALLNCSVPRRMITACPLAFGEIGVKQRIRSVLHYKKPTLWVIIVAVISCIAIAVCFLTDPKTGTLSPGARYVEYDSKVTFVQYSSYEIDLGKTVNPSAAQMPLYRITDKEELDAFCAMYDAQMKKYQYSNDYGFTQAMRDYTASFFEEKELFVSFIEAGSSSHRYDVVSVIRDHSLLRLLVAPTNNPSIGDAMMAKWMFTVAVNKSDLADCDTYDIQYQNFQYDIPTGMVYDRQYECEEANARLLLSKEGYGGFQLLIGTETSGNYSLFCGYASQNDRKIVCYTETDVFHFYFDNGNLRYERTKPSTTAQSLLPTRAVFKPILTVDEQNGVLYGVAIADIDGDGIEERCSLGAGTTSGLFTFTLKASNDTGVNYYGVFYSDVCNLSFVKDKNGKLLIRGEEADDQNKVHFLDISVENGNLQVSENGKPLIRLGN